MTRRDLLKILAASGGALAAAAFLPARWSKPLVAAGVLPVHAQSTTQLSISNLIVDHEYPGFSVVTFSYADPLGEVTSSGILYAELLPCEISLSDGLPIYSTAWFQPESTPYSGRISFELTQSCDPGPTTLQIQIAAGGRTSNILIAIIVIITVPYKSLTPSSQSFSVLFFALLASLCFRDKETQRREGR